MDDARDSMVTNVVTEEGWKQLGSDNGFFKPQA